jgi:hypothetical protein
MIVTKREKYEDVNSNNNSDKEDQYHNPIFMEKDEEIASEEQNKELDAFNENDISNFGSFPKGNKENNHEDGISFILVEEVEHSEVGLGTNGMRLED